MVSMEPIMQDSEDLPSGSPEIMAPLQVAEMVVQATQESAGTTPPYTVSRPNVLLAQSSLLGYSVLCIDYSCCCHIPSYRIGLQTSHVDVACQQTLTYLSLEKGDGPSLYVCMQGLLI